MKPYNTQNPYQALTIAEAEAYLKLTHPMVRRFVLGCPALAVLPSIISMVNDGDGTRLDHLSYWHQHVLDDIARLQALTLEEKRAELFTEVQLMALYPNGTGAGNDAETAKSAALLSDHGIAALREELVSVEQIQALSDPQVRNLFSDHGIAALREELVSVEQIQALSNSQVQDLLTANGIAALHKGLISVEQIQALSDPQVRDLLSDNEIAALREAQSSRHFTL
jgi:hypothetical protein